MKKIIEKLVRNRVLIDKSVDRLEEIQEKTLVPDPVKKIFIKTESSQLLSLSWSLLWKSLTLWVKIRI